MAERCFALVMRVVPCAYRFDVALLLTRVTVPLFRKTEAYSEQQIKNFHSPREIALHLILNALTKNSTAFNPRITVNGFDDFLQAFARGQGVLVIGHHAALTLFMIRLFYEKAFDPIVVTPDSRLRVPGTLVTARTVQPSATFLVRLRSRLRSGELVCGMPDRAEHHARRTIEFATSAGQVIIAPAIIEVAVRCGAEVLFTGVRVQGRRLVATIAAPSPSSGGSSSAITEDFISFIREHTEVRPASGEDQTSDQEQTSLPRSLGLVNHSNSPAKAAIPEMN